VGFGFPARFRVEAAADAAFTEPVVLLDRTQADFENPAENPVVILAGGVNARFVRVTATRLWARSNDYIFALAELEVWSGGSNVARPVRLLRWTPSKRPVGRAVSWSTVSTVRGESLALPEWLRGLSRRREIELDLGRIALEKRRMAESVGRMALRWGAAFPVHRRRTGALAAAPGSRPALGSRATPAAYRG